MKQREHFKNSAMKKLITDYKLSPLNSFPIIFIKLLLTVVLRHILLKTILEDKFYEKKKKFAKYYFSICYF